MKAIFVAIVLILSVPYAVQTSEAPGQRVVKVQKTNLTRDEEIQLGERVASSEERKLKLVHNSELERWLSQVGAKLGGTQEARGYPYRFKLVDDVTINANAFPGGLIYVNTGLLAGAVSESEVAGALAHEMSHVALRHGAGKETKMKEWRTALQVAGIAASIAGVGLAGEAINLGGEAGIRATMSSKYSRDAEFDADLNGARMMAAAGYNPEAVAHLLEGLGQSTEPPHSKVSLHGPADHPDNAKRAELIREDIKFYPAKTYEAESGRFNEVQTTVAQLSPAGGKQSAFIPAGGTR